MPNWRGYGTRIKTTGDKMKRLNHIHFTPHPQTHLSLQGNKLKIIGGAPDLRTVDDKGALK
jgi:hypothetical protein